MNNPNVASAFGTREEYRGSSNDFYHLIRKNLQEGKNYQDCIAAAADRTFFMKDQKFCRSGNQDGMSGRVL